MDVPGDAQRRYSNGPAPTPRVLTCAHRFQSARLRCWPAMFSVEKTSQKRCIRISKRIPPHVCDSSCKSLLSLCQIGVRLEWHAGIWELEFAGAVHNFFASSPMLYYGGSWGGGLSPTLPHKVLLFTRWSGVTHSFNADGAPTEGDVDPNLQSATQRQRSSTRR